MTTKRTDKRVQATRLGYIHEERKRPGDVFDVRREDFTARWMREVPAETPLRSTTGQQTIDAEHDAGAALGRVKRISSDPPDELGTVTVDVEDDPS